MTTGTRQESLHESLWSLFLSSIFALILGFSIYYFYKKETDFSVTVFDMLILILAIFRLTRLLVYDNIALFIRELFLDTTKKWNSKSGLYDVTREKPKQGVRRKLAELFACPWCTGVWVSLFAMFFYYYSPTSMYVFILLAAAGASSFIQLSANLVGWNAENKKIEAELKSRK